MGLHELRNKERDFGFPDSLRYVVLHKQGMIIGTKKTFGSVDEIKKGAVEVGIESIEYVPLFVSMNGHVIFADVWRDEV
jgi:hypothetical protein